MEPPRRIRVHDLRRLLHLPEVAHQLVDSAGPDRRQRFRQAVVRPVPPLHFEQRRHGIGIETLFDRFGRNASDDRIGRNIARNDGPGADHGAVPDMHSGKDQGLITDPHIVTDHNIPFIIPRGRNFAFVDTPLAEERKGVVRQRTHRVIRAVEKKFRPAGDRAEPTDTELIPVYRIVVEHVVPFEEPRIRRKIVIDRIISDLDVLSGNDFFQVYGLRISRMGIEDIRLLHLFLIFYRVGKSGTSSRSSATNYIR